MTSARRMFWLATVVTVVAAAPTLSQVPLKNHSLTVDIPGATVCRDGATFVGEAIAASSLNLVMTPQVFDQFGATLQGSGIPHTFTAVGEMRTFTVMYPVGTFNIGDPIGISISDVVGSPSGPEGFFNNTRTVDDCLLGIPATPGWALALLLLLLVSAGAVLVGKAPGVLGRSGRGRVTGLFLLGVVGSVPALATIATTPPTFSKEFLPSTIGPGSTTTLRFVIDNTDETNETVTTPLTDLAFTDVLPAEITIATPASAFTDCTDAILTAPDGGGTISLIDGRLGADSVCTVSVNVTSSVIGEGPHTNTSGYLTSSAGSHGMAVADLTVEGDRPGFSKEFVPSTIPLLGTSRLIFSIDNPAAIDGGLSAFQVQFSDLLPAGLQIAQPANTFTDCPSGTIFIESIEGEAAEFRQIRFTTVASPLTAGSSCTVEVDVKAVETGLFVNTSADLESTTVLLGTPRSSGFATAALDVPVEFLVKSFIDDPVAPGGIVTLRFIVTNLDRDFPATAIAFTDDLDPLGSLTGLAPSGPLPTDPCGAGSTLAFAAGTGELSLSDGDLGPGDSCEFDVALLVPAGASTGSYTNTTGAITATIDGEGVVGNTASDDLVVSLTPTVTKEFIDDPAPAGGTVTLRFTLTNTSSATGFFDLAFEDSLETAIPGLAANGLVGMDGNAMPVPDVCGTGSELTLFDPPDLGPPFNIIIPADPTILEFSGGSLAPAGMPGDSCTFDVVLDIPAGTPGGIYTNTTGDITGLLDFSESPFTALGVSGDLEVIGAPRLIKEFVDDPVGPGETVTLEFTLSHDEFAPGDAAAIAFSDDLAALDPAIAGLAATGLPLVGACNGTGTLTGTTLLDFSGGELAPGESCTFSVTLAVPGVASPGPHTNTTSAVVATVDGVPGVTGNAAEDDLRIDGLELTKLFIGDPVLPGDTVTLEFVIKNVHPTETASSITIKDDMATILGGSPDIEALDGSAVSDVCAPGNGSITWTAGDTLMTFSGGTLAPGEMCTFSVVLLVPGGAVSGVYTNSTGAGGLGGGPGFTAFMPIPTFIVFDEATDDLVINNVFLDLAKEFTNDPVAPGGSATLKFTITNLDPVTSIFGITFDDDLDAALLGLVATAATDTCGGSIDSMFPTGLFEYSGGTVAGGASCTIELTLSVPALPVGTLAFNQTSPITGSLGIEGPTVVGDPATDTLRLGFLTLEKVFDGPTKPGEAVDLTFTISNLSTSTVADLGFTDDLELTLPGLLATGLPFAACGGTATTFDGGSTLVFFDGSLAAAGSPGDSCLFTVTLSVPTEAPFGTFPNTTSDLSQEGLALGDPGVDDLVIEPPIDFSKAFLPDPIGPGSTTVLEFTITNDSGTLAEDVAFTDVLPAGVVIATPSSAFTDCTDGILSAPDGGTTISLTGARVGLGVTCTVTVNVTAAAAGTYDNLSGELTSTAGSGGFAEATLTVDAGRPGFSKSFAPATTPPGGTSTLTFTVDLSAAGEGADVGNLNFTDTLPAGLVVATPSNAATDCETLLLPAFLLADPGTGVITLSATGLLPSFPVLEAGETCTVVVDVTAASDDLYENVSGDLFIGPSPTFVPSAGFATAELDVREGFLVKSFTDDPVPPGGTVTLEFTINNPSRDLAASDIAFTDDLDAVLPGTPDLTVLGSLPTDPCGAGSTLTVAPVNVLTLAGGSLPAEGSCTFSVTLDVPVGAASGIHTNTTSSISATIDGMTEMGDPASDDLRVVAFPILTKEFLDAVTMDPDPVVGANDDVKIRFTITNTSTTSAATDISFFDELTTFLPFPISVTLPPVPDPPCGAGSSLTLDFCGTDCQGLQLSAGSLAAAPGAGSSCSFDVTLSLPVGLPQGTYVNTTDEITATVDAEPVAGFPAADSFDLVAAPRLTKEFTNDPVQPGGTVTLEFTLEHDALAPGDAVDVEFTDDLAAVVAGLAAAAGELPATDLCGPGNGELTGTAGDTALNFAGATLAPGEICTFSVTLDVPVDAPAGTHTNKTSNVVATVLGHETTENRAEDGLTIGGLVLTKTFLDDPVIAGGEVILEFVISNLSPEPVTDIFFEDLLDPDVLAGLTVLEGSVDGGMFAPLPLADPCGTGSLLETFSAPEIVFPPVPAIDEALRLTGGSLDPVGPVEGSGTCTFAVKLMVPVSTPSGDYVNRTRDLEATIDTVTLPFPNAQDNLTVATGQLLLTKEFTDDPVLPGATVTLEFTIATLGAFDEASDLAFSDDLGAALAGLEGVPPYDTGTCGGSLTGTSLLDFSGGSLTAAECSFSVDVMVPSPLPIGTTATNRTSSLTGTIEGLAVTGEPATDILLINSFNFSKAFDGATTPSGTPVLTFTIENLSATDSVAGLTFTDNLDAVIGGLVATSLPVAPCGPGSVMMGTSLLTLTGGNLLPGGSCTFDVDLLVPPIAGGTSFVNTTSDLRIAGVPVAAPAEATLFVEPAPTFAKVFDPDLIAQGTGSRLTFTIDNTASGVAVTGLAFDDVLPFDLLLSATPNLVNGCGGTVSAVPFDTTISLVGGTLSAGESCTIEVDVSGPSPGTFVNTSTDLTSSSGNSGKAIDVLGVGVCVAANGVDFVLPGQLFFFPETFEACNTITVSPHTTVFGPSGSLTLRAGVAVLFENGVSVQANGVLTVEIDPILLGVPPP